MSSASRFRGSVLLEFKDSKKEISLDDASDNAVKILEEHLKRIDNKIRLVIDYGAQTQQSGGDDEHTYILQRFSKEWGEFVDVIDTADIEKGDHLKVVPLPRSVQADSTQQKGPNEKAESLLATMKKPTNKQALTLSKLFPSTSKKFNPLSECTATSAHAKKKKFTTGTSKLSAVTVILLKNYQTRVPKGDYRQELIHDNRVKKVELNRRMTPSEVNKAIVDKFGCKGFAVLDCVKGGYLLKNDQQLTSSMAIDRRGALYLFETVEVAYSDSDPDVPATTKSLKRTIRDSDSDSDFDNSKRVKRTNKDLTSVDNYDVNLTIKRADDCLEKLRKVPKDQDSSTDVPIMEECTKQDLGSVEEPITLASDDEEFSSRQANLEEYRRIRKEQDEEYERSLQADRLKEEEKENKKKLDEVRVQLRSKVEEMMNSDGAMFTLSVILPNSARITCRLEQSSTSKALYEAVFVMSDLDRPFRIFTRVGHIAVDPAGSSLHDVVKMSSVLVVEIDENAPDLYHLFATQDNIAASSPASKGARVRSGNAPNDLCIGIGEANLSEEDYCSVSLREQEFIKRETYMQSLSCEQGSPHLIRRDHVYNDVLELYKDFSAIATEFPFCVAFNDEQAIDSGGVARDMFSGFWSCAFDKSFDGSGSLVPATHPTIDMSVFPTLGKILSHGYIACAFLPVHISFPVIAAAILGPDVQISDPILCKSFITYLSFHDAGILRDAFGQLESTSFSSHLQSSLMVLLGNYGCRQIPSPQNLQSLVTMVARHQFLVKPLAALYLMFGGIPNEHKNYWKDVSVDHLMKLYVASNATACNVLKVIKEPLVLEPLQENTYYYLLQYVGNMSNSEVRHFLRYVTGSSALVVDEISVTFNGLSGMSRRPIAHTCSSTLELPVTYSTYLDFSKEFNAVLDNELSWIMDAL